MIKLECEKLLDDELKTLSSIDLHLSEQDDGKELICRSENPRFASGAIEQRKKINVSCKKNIVHVNGFSLKKKFSYQ